MIAVTDLRKDFGGVRALDGVTFSAEPGSVVGIVGPNGSGKSTLFDIIAGAAKPLSGTVTFEGVRIDGLAAHEIARRGISRTRQATRMFERMTVLENVVAGAYLLADDGFLAHLVLAPSARRRRASLEVAARGSLAAVGLQERAGDAVQNLTEGERRRAGLARAIVAKPKLLLLDELSAGLDAAEWSAICSAILLLARERQCVVLVGERDLATCLTLCQRVVVLHAGRMVTQSDPLEASRNPDVLDAYLGVEWRQ